MKLPSKRLILTSGSALLTVAWAMTGPNFSRYSSMRRLPLGTVAFAQGARLQMSDAAFKNIQVLKGIPVDEFMGTMGLFSAALAVCCGDCHTGAGTDHPDWAADPPRKVTARRMVQMVNAINRDNFKGAQVVTCWTCHRGAQTPSTTPPLDSIYTGNPVVIPPDVLPAAPPATSGTPPADQILDKFVQASGGAANWAKFTSYVAKGTSTLFGEAHSDPAEIYAKAPNQLTVLVHQKEGDLARTYNGSDAWVMLPLTVVGEYPLSPSAKAGAKLDAQMAFPGRIKEAFTNWKVSYPTTLCLSRDDNDMCVENKDLYVVQGTSQGIVATFYFDKQTGLLRRMIHYANSAMGRVPTQIDYSDYRPVGGVQMPFKFTYGWVSGREQYALSEIQPNAAVDAAKFAMPVQRPRQ